jgi:hypothetical protein
MWWRRGHQSARYSAGRRNHGDCTITLPRSKTDQHGVGRKIGIPYGSNPDTCPVRTVQAWLEQAAFKTGSLFRSINRHGQVQAARLTGIDVARVVKKLALRAGLDASKIQAAFNAVSHRLQRVYSAWRVPKTLFAGRKIDVGFRVLLLTNCTKAPPSIRVADLAGAIRENAAFLRRHALC